MRRLPLDPVSSFNGTSREPAPSGAQREKSPRSRTRSTLNATRPSPVHSTPPTLQQPSMRHRPSPARDTNEATRSTIAASHVAPSTQTGGMTPADTDRPIIRRDRMGAVQQSGAYG